MDPRAVLWMPLALTAAVAFAAHNGLAKRWLAGLSPLDLALGSHAVYAAASSLILALAALSGTDALAPRPGFLAAAAATSALNVSAILLLFRGIRSSALSESMPFLSLTPVFVVLTGRLVLGEAVGWRGGAAVLAVAVGSWLVGSGATGSLRTPWKRILSEPGPRNLLAVAAIFSVSSVLDKLALQRSNLPLFLFTVAWIKTSLLAGAVALGRVRPASLARLLLPSLGVGGLFALEAVAHMAAVAVGPVAYVLAVKRSSVLISALVGFFAFGEPRSPRLVAGILFTVGGAVALGFA